MRKIELKTKITRLEQGIPQDWIYIERKVLGDLTSNDNEGVKAPSNFIGKYLADIFRKDIIDVNSRQLAMIRPIIGPNGAGKTTQMEIQIKKIVNNLFQDKLIYLFFDFKHITSSKEEFWPIFIQEFYEQLQENRYLQQLCSALPQNKLKSDLINKFKNTTLVEHVLKSISNDDSTQAMAKEYFYGDKISPKTVADFFNGFLELALGLDKLVVFCLDELQFLIDIDPEKILVKMILEQFIRKLLEQYRNKRLYIVISCLQNPDKKEYDSLKEISKNFNSIIDGKEIILGNLQASERQEILNQVCEKINMEPDERKRFLSEIKGQIGYFIPRYLLKSIAETLDKFGFTAYSSPELKNLYEKEAREHISSKLKEKGFVYIDPAPKEIGQFHIDIHASYGTERHDRTPEAFGEVTMANRKKVKDKVEKFMAWLHAMKGKEYRPELNDYAFFICPSNRLTPKSLDTLKSNNIEFIEFDSTFINEISQLEQKEQIKIQEDQIETQEISEIAEAPEIIPSGPVNSFPKDFKDREIISVEEKPIIIKKHKKNNLKDIKGIGDAYSRMLNAVGINDIDGLIKCNPKTVAKKVSGLGENRLNKWIQMAKQIIYG